MGRLVSVNVGLPKNVQWRDKTVYTGIWKTPVEGPVMVRRLNVDGDGQGDLAGHGGEQRAVMVYQSESYDFWQNFLGRGDLRPGHFGENFTVSGLADDDVCIGDRYRIGDAEFEVTQPRVTCFRVGIRLDEPDMPNLLVSQHRPGFYFRVITEGRVRAGDEIVRTRRGRHELSVADVDALLYLPDRSAETLRKAIDVPALSPGWQQSFHELLAAHGDTATAPAAPIGPGWKGFRDLRVTQTHWESPQVLSIRLERWGWGVPQPDTKVFCCGPSGLLDAVQQLCRTWPDGTLHLERFAAGSLDASVQADAGTFTVVAERSGVTCEVGVGESITDALGRAGIIVPTSCREGICGTCETKVIAGIPEHRDFLLGDADRESGATMLICVSRAKTPELILDV